jgi:hypothetical protein
MRLWQIDYASDFQSESNGFDSRRPLYTKQNSFVCDAQERLRMMRSRAVVARQSHKL